MDEPTYDDRREQAPGNESEPEQVAVILRRMFEDGSCRRCEKRFASRHPTRPSVPSFLYEWQKMIVSKFGPGSTTRLVLLALSLHMEADGGSCRPSVRLLAQDTGLNKDTVSKHLTLADKDGWIERQERAVEGRAWRRNEYQATLPQHVQPRRAPCADVSEQTGHPEARRVRNDAVDVSEQPVQSTYIEDVTTLGASEGNPPPPPRDAYPPTFERFWAAYPRRAGGNPKKAALRQWRATRRKGVTAEELEEAVSRYAAYCDATGKTGTEYVKQASTFLGRDEHWREDWTVPSENGPSPEQGYESGRKVLEALEASP